MSDPRTILECRLMQAHGIAFTMSDVAGDASDPETMRCAWYGVAELIQQARDAYHAVVENENSEGEA